MSRISKALLFLFLLASNSACASLKPESTKERTYEPYSKTQNEPEGYDDPCFDRKKARKTPGCLAYDPDA